MIKIWLPLNKDERNIGLSPGFCTNSGVTYSEGGPNGTNCAKFTGSNQYVKMPIGGLTGMTDYCTVCFWLRVDAWNASWQTAFAFLKSGTPWTGNVFTFIRDNASSAFTFSISNGSSSTQSSLKTNALSLNTWYHFACVYEPGLMSLYQNGELLRTYSTTIKPCFSAITHAALGVECNPSFTSISYQHRGAVSDFRVYDHRLKEWEIKKIYNGLSFGISGGLHLKTTTNLMDGKDYSVGNLTTNCTTQNDADGGKYVMTTTRVGSYTSDSIRLQFPSTVGFTDGKDYSISYDYKVGVGSGNLHQGLDINDGTPAVNVIDKENGIKRVEVIVESGTPKYSYNTYRFIDFNKIAQNSKYKIWRMQVEEGKTPTPYTPSHRDERYVDLSGFDNEVIPYNITQRGSSFYFNGVDSAIQIPLHKMISGGTYSINLWFYRPNGEFSSKGYESFFGGPSGFELDSKNGTGTTPCVYIISAFGSGSKTYDCDKWNMVTMTRTPSESKFYLNGVLFKTGSAGTTPVGSYFIGAWVSRTQQNFKGYIKNFSVFNKQLSDNDVMNLYIHGE